MPARSDGDNRQLVESLVAEIDATRGMDLPEPDRLVRIAELEHSIRSLSRPMVHTGKGKIMLPNPLREKK